MKLHELDEWYQLQDKPIKSRPYESQKSRLRITKTQLTFEAYDGLKLKLRKSNKKNGGLSLKFSEYGGKRKTKWLWMWEHFTPDESKRIAFFLLSHIESSDA